MPLTIHNDIPLNLNTDGQQSVPQLAGLTNGRFVAVWTNFPTAASSGEVHVQVFNADGSRHGTEYSFTPQSVTDSRDHPVVGLADGNFELAWSQYDFDSQEGYTYKIMAQTFSPDGVAVDTPHALASSLEQFALSTPSLAARPDGGFAATWESCDVQQTGAVDVVAQFVDASGNPSGAAAALTAGSQAYYPLIARLSDGRFAVTWWDNRADDIGVAILDADGTVAQQHFTANTTRDGSQYQPAITALADGNFAVAWADGSGSDYDIRGQIFGSDGAKHGDEFVVNTTTFNTQFFPAVATLKDGRFVTVWTDYSAAGNQTASDIRAQLFNPDGSKSGDEFLVNVPGTGYHSYPTVTALADGRFVVGWDGDALDSSSLGEHAVIVDPRDGAVHLIGTPHDDDFVGTPFDDTMEGRGGNDHFDGGAGDDTAIFAHPRSAYTITQQDGATIVSGPDGATTLIGFEHLQFADETAPPSAPPHSPPTVPADPGIIGLFDTRYYLTHYGDVSLAKASGFDHFNSYGWHEGRDPNAWFDTSAYLAVNKEVAASGVNPLTEYHQSGWREGRDPGPNFDVKLYLVHNPDVAAAGVDPLEHYLQHGRSEGRATYAAVGHAVNGFDAEWYLFHNPDVAAAGVDPLQHYQQNGWHEGRNPNPWFDTAGYLAHYADVAAAGIDPLQHYEQNGWKEGRDPSASFDTNGYLAANPDVAAAHLNPLDHFINNGIYEGRAAVSDGVWH